VTSVRWPIGRAGIERLHVAAAHEAAAPTSGAGQDVDSGAVQQPLPPGSGVFFRGRRRNR
jgi:hypothetical protein